MRASTSPARAITRLSRIDADSPGAPATTCWSSIAAPARARKRQRRAAVRAAQTCETYILDGGIDAWKKAGLPVTLDRSQPIDIMRQVQIARRQPGACSGVVLGTLVAPGFYALSAFVGAGLLFAGISGFCGMARLLALMPWNRRTLTRSVMTILHALLAIASGSLVGFTLGLVGGGGSILAVPLLVYVVGVPSPHVAIGTSAIAVAVERSGQSLRPRPRTNREMAVRDHVRDRRHDRRGRLAPSSARWSTATAC